MSLRWCLKRWRLWIRPVAMILNGAILLVVLPLCIWRLQQGGASTHQLAWFSSGIFVLMALPITFWEITQHLVHYTKPYLQKHIIRILWMVPIYALNSWLGLTFPGSSIYLDTLRECYEAFVIYNFMVYLLNFLYFDMDLETIIEYKQPVKPIFPFCCLPACPAGRIFIENCKHQILQYTVIRPITTIITLICEIAGVYCEGEFSVNCAYPYIVAINNISQFIAMYSLALFYFAHKEELAPMKPVGKFFCIKAVVFFSFFQSVVIAILVWTHVITESFIRPNGDLREVSRSLQDFLVCIEMFMAAVAHYFAFSHKPYVDLAAEQVPCCVSFMSMWDVSDMTRDVSDHIRHVGKTMKRTVVRRSGSIEDLSEQRQPLIDPVTNSRFSSSHSYNSISDDASVSARSRTISSNQPSIVDDLVDLSSCVEPPR